MEDEISKHTKKIYSIAKDKHHTTGEKIKEVVIEVMIIVFAVTLSIWLHSWSEKRHEQEEVKAFLTGLKQDLTKDIKLLEKNKQSITQLDSNYHYIVNLVESKKKDTIYNRIIGHKLYFNIPQTHPNIGRYDGFKSSGKIGNIENDSLKQNILVFYQQTIPDVGYGESYVNSLQLKILDWEIDRNEKLPILDFVSTSKMQSYLSLGMHNFDVNIGHYNDALALAKKIIEQINEEVKK